MTITSRALFLGLCTTTLALASGCGDDETQVSPSGTAATTGTTSSTTSSSSAGGAGGDGGNGGNGGNGAGGSGTGGDPGCQPVGTQALRVDLVLAIDNSRSMADKQEILALTIPDLVQAFTNPRCVDAQGNPVAQQPADHTQPCPNAASSREFEPVFDMHIGIVSSSIGGHGADSCPDAQGNSNDHGHLLSRAPGGGMVATYEDKGFLAWDPGCQLDPKGETSPAAFIENVRLSVLGVDQIGCGYESQLESWYRFLVDPIPYDTIPVINGIATPTGIDDVLLQQRVDFLRPDSLLAIVMLTDENDCSTKEFGQFYYAGQLFLNGNPFHLPRARQECQVDPNDPCCKSCGLAPGACPPDPTCGSPLTPIEDQPGVRCWDQKRRFGIDFLYPSQRYVNALTLPAIDPSSVDLSGPQTVPNPIFSDLNPNDPITTVRGPELVFLAGVVGVPWQDIARDPSDISQGYKNAIELNEPNGNGVNAWDIALGDPASYISPLDPLMVESADPRSGVNPVTGDPIVTSADPLGNPINGHDFANPERTDLQYACIFPLLTPKDCSDPNLSSCDCNDPTNDSPLCENDPMNGGQPTRQVRGKAYPGTRELQVLKGVGEQGVVASICAVQTENPSQSDFGYRPAVRAIIDATRSRLAP
jgi:hypothetical protein